MKTNPRVGSYYLLGAAALACIASISLPWGLLLVWPTLSLAIISLGYFKLGQIVYFKQNGDRPTWAKLLHGFTIYGQELSRCAYAKQCEPWNKLLPNLLIGRQLKDSEVDRLKSEGIGKRTKFLKRVG